MSPIQHDILDWLDGNGAGYWDAVHQAWLLTDLRRDLLLDFGGRASSEIVEGVLQSWLNS